jgi:putative transposase
LVEPGHPELSVRRQCELLGLSRSSLYYQPAAETADNLRLMRLLDQEYTAHPFLGSRRLTKWLVEQGEVVNRKRVQRRMRRRGSRRSGRSRARRDQHRATRFFRVCCASW